MAAALALSAAIPACAAARAPVPLVPASSLSSTSHAEPLPAAASAPAQSPGGTYVTLSCLCNITGCLAGVAGGITGYALSSDLEEGWQRIGVAFGGCIAGYYVGNFICGVLKY